MFGLFNSKPIVDEDSRQWLNEAFIWAMEHFDGKFFARQSQLILPTNAFFPARENSVEALASSVFEKVRGYCGLTHWPLTLVDPAHFVPQQYQLSAPVAIVRGDNVDPQMAQNMLSVPGQQLAVSYDPVQLNQPQVMVANYAAMMANYLMGAANQPVPGGPEHRAPAVEVLAIFMGFGVMFANTAYAFRGGCGSCHNHAANRVAVLTENESLYVLALFCTLKQIDAKTVTPHLKGHLRGMFKQAMKSLKKDQSQTDGLSRLLNNKPTATATEH